MKEKMLNRTICLRVAEVRENTKSEFYSALRSTLEMSRRVANVVLTECVKNDPAWGDIEADKFPALGKVYTYPSLKYLQSGWSGELSNLVRQYESKYKNIRFDMLRGKCSLPSIRSAPWPLLHNESCKNMRLELLGDELTAVIKLVGGRFTVKLKRGSNYRDQVAGVIKAVEAGNVGDSKVWVDRNGVAVLGISVKIPEPSKRTGKTLTVRTTSDSFLVMCRDRSTTPYVINGSLLKKKMARKSSIQQKLRQDIKPKQKRRVRRELARVSDSYSRFLDTFTHQVSAQIVSFATRNGYARIEFDDAIKSYFKQFPWFQLRERISYKCDDNGIEFSHSPTIAFERCDIFAIPTPHVYFAVELNRDTGELTNQIKIGKTKKPTLERMSGIGGQTNLAYEPIAVYESKASSLTKDEKMFHSLFAEHRVTNDRELFNLNPIKTWLRERGAIDD